MADKHVHPTGCAQFPGLSMIIPRQLARHAVVVGGELEAAAFGELADVGAVELLPRGLVAELRGRPGGAPRGRFVEVAEIAAMVAWLASAENSFTTGAVFGISGGRATY